MKKYLRKFFSSSVWYYIRIYFTFTIIICCVLVAYLFNRIFINIYPGQRGVYWKRFGGGTVMDYIYGEGLHIIPPWNKMYIYDTRIQHRSFTFDALSKDGLRIRFDISVLFYPDKKYLPLLHTRIGPNYIEKVVRPEIQAQLRKVVANYYPEEIYTSEGYLLQIIKQGAMAVLATKHIVLDDLLIKRMTLPEAIRKAIEKKLVQKQRVMEYDYILQKEIKEAKRKTIEAEGIRKFQEIVKSGNFFEKYLQFKGIEATLALAKSSNSKIVIIGGRDGLPLIFNLGFSDKISNVSICKQDKPKCITSLSTKGNKKNKSSSSLLNNAKKNKKSIKRSLLQNILKAEKNSCSDSVNSFIENLKKDKNNCVGNRK